MGVGSEDVKRGKGKKPLEGVLSSGLTLWVAESATEGESFGGMCSELSQPRGKGAGVLILQLPCIMGESCCCPGLGC